MKKFWEWFDSLPTISPWIPVTATIAFLVALGALWINQVAHTYPYPFSTRPDPSKLALVSSVDSASCPLCHGLPYEAPCVFDTSTGICTELRIYPAIPNSGDPYSISEPVNGESYGFVSTLSGTGFSGLAIPDEDAADIYFNTDQLIPYDPYTTKDIVCQSCLNKLNFLNPHSLLILVDMQNSYIFDILPKSEFNIRHYHIIIGKVDDWGKLPASVTSSYFNS